MEVRGAASALTKGGFPALTNANPPILNFYRQAKYNVTLDESAASLDPLDYGTYHLSSSTIARNNNDFEYRIELIAASGTQTYDLQELDGTNCNLGFRSQNEASASLISGSCVWTNHLWVYYAPSNSTDFYEEGYTDAPGWAPVLPSGMYYGATTNFSTNNGYTLLTYSGESTLSPAYSSTTYSARSQAVEGTVPCFDVPRLLQERSYSCSTELSDIYTDADLKNNLLTRLALPDGWGSGSASASFQMSPDHANAYGSRCQYRFGLSATTKGESYRVRWKEVTRNSNGVIVSERMKSQTVAGTGNPERPVYTHSQKLDMPGYNCTSVVEFLEATLEPKSTPGSGGAAGGCVSCRGGRASATGMAGPGFEASLGSTSDGYSAGWLGFASALPDINLYSPALLACDAESADVEVILANNIIRQIRAPETLVDVLVDSTNKYSVCFWHLNDVGSTTNATGLYQTNWNGHSTPFVVWAVENPDPPTTNQVRISEFRDSVLVSQRTYLYSNSCWVEHQLGNLAEQVTSTLYTNGTRQVVTVIRSPSGEDVSRVKRTYQAFSWGDALIEECLGTEDHPQKTTYSYYALNSGSGSQLPVKQITHPDGSWEYYAYTGNGLPGAAYSSFGDLPVSSRESARKIEYGYGAGHGDNGTISSNRARLVVEKVQGWIVSRSYTLFPSAGLRLDIQCTTTNASWNDPNNLITTNLFYTSGPNQFALQAVIRPDGTLTTYDYITNTEGYRTNITITGEPDSSFSSVVDGVRSQTVINRSGQLVSSASYDVLTGTLLSLEVYGDFDRFGRPLRVTHLDGTSEQTHYSSCCGLDYTTDREGVTTWLYTDAAGRPTASSRLDITTTNVLDAAGRVLRTIRIGSDNSQVTLHRSAYDLAGELIRQTNALGGVTVHIHTNDPVTGGLIQVAINPAGGTQTNFHYLDGSLKMALGTAVQGLRTTNTVEPDGGMHRLVVKEIKLNADGTDSPEWTKTYTDLLGRAYKTVYADNAGSESFYNSKGQLWKQRDPDGVTTLYTYNPKGELEYSIVALSSLARSQTSYGSLISNLSAILAGTDRITRTVADVTTEGGSPVRRVRAFVWGSANANTSNLASIAETSVDGLSSWQVRYADATTAVTNRMQTVYSSGGNRHVTNTAPDGSCTVGQYQNGRLVSVTRKDAINNQLSATNYSYDAHGRESAVADARNGATVLGYHAFADLVERVTTPPPAPSQPAQTTVTHYNQSLQAANVLHPDGTRVFTEYYPSGLLKKTWGSRTYPVEYTYDYAGRMKTMKTWRDFAADSGAAITAWNYNSRGFLSGKTYDGGAAGPAYTYTGAGRLQTRAWARGITTTYTYSHAGDLERVTYTGAAAPNVTNAFDRLGKQATAVCNGITNAMTYNLAGGLLSESFTSGSLNGLSITNGFDSYLRRTNLALLNQLSPLSTISYLFDSASRLRTVSAVDPGPGTVNSATYSYIANSPLVGHTLFTNSGVRRMTTIKKYDYLNRLTSISTVNSQPTAISSHEYRYNQASQRTRAALSDGSYWLYEYDLLGQVTSGKKYWSDQTPVAGQQFEYAHDDIGNRRSVKSGGDDQGAGLRSAHYSANSLNQYTSRDVPGFVDVLGLSFATFNVMVNGQSAYRKGEYFRKELDVANESAPVWQSVIVATNDVAGIGGNVFVPGNTETFTHDADGNLTQDGRWVYEWDGENRLQVARSLPGSPAPERRIEFAYDSRGRRIRQTVWNDRDAGQGGRLSDTLYLYDGWNLLAELNANAGNARVRTYTWGLDLSGSEQGAGGVGGLLQVSHFGAQTTNCFVAFDGNGNVAALVNAADGAIVAQYEYGPFGETLRSTGPMAKLNPLRFSTKHQDDETDLLYYGYRYYVPSIGRWLSRDPIEEWGGMNFYGFVHNDSINVVDIIGLGYGNPVPPAAIGPIPMPPFPPIGGIPPGPLPLPTFPPIGQWPPLPPAPPKPPGPPPILIPSLPPKDPLAPPRQPPSGAPTNPGHAAGGAVVVCARLWNDIFNSWQYSDGIRICRSQMGSQSKTGEKCCVMHFCIGPCCVGGKSIKRVMAYLDNNPCWKAKEDFETGRVLKVGCPNKSDTQATLYDTMFRLN